MQLSKAIEKRWSPIAFSEKPVSGEMILLLFEAARRAPSARNEQPWNYYYVHRNDEKLFSEVLEMLTGNNPLWAKEAQVLIISVVKKNYDYQNRPNGNAFHDIGAANVSLAIQAAEMGLQVHQMGGFVKEKVSQYLKLDTKNFEPVTIIAVGFPDEDRPYTDRMEKRKIESDTRKPVQDFVFKLRKE